MDIGQDIYEFCESVFPYCRSITGEGVRKTLRAMQAVCPKLKIIEVPSGTQVFDWKVPLEWNCEKAYIEDSNGEKIIDFAQNNLHVVGYSIPVDKYVSLEKLKEVVHTCPELPDAIPYVTSYYKEDYGFCMAHSQLVNLRDDTYHILIDSSLQVGSLTYGEIVIPGGEKEVMFSTYICHPSMANNELSGPSVAIHLARHLLKLENLRYTYRFIFVPETIGSITYLSRNLEVLKKKVDAGFNLSCLGDDQAYTYVATKYANTLADKVAKNILHSLDKDYHKYSFLKRGSDERQYNMPGIDLPVCGIYRSKSHEYIQYHTSLDNMDFINPKALKESYEMLLQIVRALEHNYCYKITCLCEPQLGRRGLYPKTSVRGGARATGAFKYIDFLAYADGSNDLLDISNLTGIAIVDLIGIADRLEQTGLIEKVKLFQNST